MGDYSPPPVFSKLLTIPFAYNTPGIAVGAPLYVPNPGDYLIDAWIETDVAWNATALGDFGLFNNGYTGLLHALNAATSTTNQQDMTQAWMRDATSGLFTDQAANNELFALCTYDLSKQWVPSKFVDASPLCILVNQTGLPGGAASLATKGSGFLCIRTTTPLT